MTAQAWISVAAGGAAGGLLALVFLVFLDLWARFKDQRRRITELDAELKLWEAEAAEIEDESEEERFSRDLHLSCLREDERTAARIVAEMALAGLAPPDFSKAWCEAVEALLLRELRNAWKSAASDVHEEKT